MSDFATTALLDVEVDQGSLRGAKQTIENELSGASVAVDGGSGAASAAGAASGAGAMGARGSRRMVSMAQQRTEYLERSVELLDNIAEDDGGGGLGFLSGMGARSALGGIGGGAVLGGLTGTLTVSAASVLAVSGTLGLAAASVLAVTGTIDMNPADIITTTGVLTLGIGSVVAITGTLGLGAAGVLAVTGTLGLAAASVLAVTGVLSLTAGNVLSVTGVLTVGAAAALAITGTLSLPAAAAIAVVGTLTIAAGEVLDLETEQDPQTQREIRSRTTSGTAVSDQTDLPSDLPDSSLNVTESGSLTIEGADPHPSISTGVRGDIDPTDGSDETIPSGGGNTSVEYAPQYDVSTERDEQAIIDEIRSKQQDDLDQLKQELWNEARR